jgi:hypothetical protein
MWEEWSPELKPKISWEFYVKLVNNMADVSEHPFGQQDRAFVKTATIEENSWTVPCPLLGASVILTEKPIKGGIFREYDPVEDHADVVLSNIFCRDFTDRKAHRGHDRHMSHMDHYKIAITNPEKFLKYLETGGRKAFIDMIFSVFDMTADHPMESTEWVANNGFVGIQILID